MKALDERGSPSAKVRRRSLAFGRWAFGTRRDRMVHTVLSELSAAAAPVRAGLEPRAAYRSAKAIRQLLEVAAVGIGTPDDSLLAFVGTEARAHAGLPSLLAVSDAALRAGRARIAPVGCDEPTCGLGEAVAVPIRTTLGASSGTGTAGTLIAVTARHHTVTMALVRSAGEVARQLATQLELGAVERQRAELRDARLAALRSQMSPHFVYNTITAIASLVRTDPERARELLFRFAELCRYVLRNDHVTTTLAEELRIVHVYVELERARKGDRIEIVFRIDPATLSAPMPMMTLQPLVENAVQHGLADPAAIGRGGGARGVVTVEAQDHGDEMELTVADNGRGIEPAVLARLQSDGLPPGGRSSSASIAIANVRARLDAAFGTGARFAIESAPGEGTSVRLRLPKGGIGTGLGARP